MLDFLLGYKQAYFDLVTRKKRKSTKGLTTNLWTLLPQVPGSLYLPFELHCGLSYNLHQM
jgi:hypothetical protein